MKEERAVLPMTAELERLWLLSALEEGIRDVELGRTISANDAFFAKLRSQIDTF